MSRERERNSLAELARTKLASADIAAPVGYGPYPYEGEDPGGGGTINLGWGVSVGRGEGGGGGVSTAMPGDNGGGADPSSGGGIDWSGWDTQVQNAYQAYLGRQASASELESHHGNRGGLSAVLDFIKISPEAKEYAQKKATTTPTPAPPAGDAVKQAVLDAYKAKGLTPRDEADLNYWIGKIKGSGGFEDAQNKAYWLDRMAMQFGGVGDYSESGKVGNPGNYRIEPGYGAPEPAAAASAPAPAAAPVTVPKVAYTPRDYGTVPAFAKTTFAPSQVGAGLTQYGTNMVTMTPEAYRKLVEAQQQAQAQQTPPLSALAYLPWQQQKG